MIKLKHLVLFGILLSSALVGCSDDGGDVSLDRGVDAAALDRGIPDGVVADSGVRDARLPDQALTSDVAAPRPDAYKNPLPGLANVTLVVNLGDSIAAGYGVTADKRYITLLLNNDDTSYPAYKGKDLASAFPGISLANKARGGSTSEDLAGQVAKVPDNPKGNTLVVISIGGNDILYNIAALVDANRMKTIAGKVSAAVDKVLAHFADKTRYPGKVTLALMNVYDFTDGMGTIPQDAPTNQNCGLLKLVPAYVAQTVPKNLDVYEQAIRTYAQSKGIVLVDIRAHFAGHGFNYNNQQSKYYTPADPTLWYLGDCIHPNPRGHHEIRSLLWWTLFGA